MTPPPIIIFFSWHLEPRLANEASKVGLLEQRLVQNKLSVGKPRAINGFEIVHLSNNFSFEFWKEILLIPHFGTLCPVHVSLHPTSTMELSIPFQEESQFPPSAPLSLLLLLVLLLVLLLILVLLLVLVLNYIISRARLVVYVK